MTVRGKLLASVAGLVVIGFVGPASADQLLTGSITSASGQKLDGIQVSAKKEGSTITNSVYTDQNGDYFFPALPDGKYNVWAQALGFETSKGQVDLTATKHQDFKLAAITDPEQKIKQMPSEMLAAALPDVDLVEFIGGSPYVDGITEQPFKLDAEGNLEIPALPGLGVALDRDKVGRYTPDPSPLFD